MPEPEVPVDQQYTLKPTPGRVAVEVQTREGKYGSLFIPVTAAPDRPTIGRVCAVCDGYNADGEDYDPIFKVGDILVFGRYTGVEIEVGRKRIIVLRENDVLATLWPSEGQSSSSGPNPDLVKVRTRT